MKNVVEQTQFYKTPDEALGLYEGREFQQETMPKVVDFCVSHDIVGEKPTVGFGDAGRPIELRHDRTSRRCKRRNRYDRQKASGIDSDCEGPTRLPNAW